MDLNTNRNRSAPWKEAEFYLQKEEFCQRHLNLEKDLNC